jgi:hypothetical protein
VIPTLEPFEGIPLLEYNIMLKQDDIGKKKTT